MIGYIADPLAGFFRPAGLLFYWALYHAFGLNPLPYHVVAWTLHAVNTFLVFLVLRGLLRSPFAAVAGAIPFALRVNFADIYWSFGTIFELLACGLMLIGIYGWISWRKSWSTALLLTGIYVLAIKSKEMAITLVGVWLLYECCLSTDLWKRPARVLAVFAAPLLAMAWFSYVKVGSMRGIEPQDPYYIDLRFRTMMDGFGQYFSWLYGIHLPAAAWCILIVTLLALFVYGRERLGLFFLGYTLLTFLPVVFLVNHRWPFFWYIPFPGISGLFGIAAKYLQAALRGVMPLRRLVVLNAALLMAWAFVHGSVEFYRSRATRAYEASLARSFESFVEGVRQIEPPEPEAVIYFDRVPPNFTPQILNSAVQVVLRRSDIHAELVAAFPPSARWKLRFSDGRLQRVAAQ